MPPTIPPRGALCATKRALSAFVMIAVTLGSISPASAQQLAVDTSGRAQIVTRAQLLYNQGLGAYEAGRYDRAIAKMRESYALVPDPLILYNLTWVLIEADRFEDARATARALMSVARAPALRVAGAARLVALERRAGAADVTAGIAARAALPPIDEQRTWPSWWTWAGVGTALVSAAPLTFAWLDGAQATREHQRALDLHEAGLRERAEAEQARAKQIQDRGRAWLAGGSILAIAGLAAIALDYALGDKGSEQKGGVTASPGGGGIVVRF